MARSGLRRVGAAMVPGTLGLALAAAPVPAHAASVPGVALVIERVATIYQDTVHTNFPFAELLPNGTIALSISIGRHGGVEHPKALVSRDQGRTWEEPEQPVPTMCLAALGSGRVISLRSWGGEPRDDGTYAGRLSWSDDGGTTWISKTVPVAMPAGVRPYTHRSLVAMPDSALLCTYYSTRPGQEKAHCGLLRSTDGGETWAHFAAIADDQAAPVEGYDEPAMVRLANGDLLCLLRTGGPMFQTRSRDAGRTWSPPVQVLDHGVNPDLCLMQSGVLVASYGRPNAGIMLSLDGTGERWDEVQDLYRGIGSSYTTVREVEPGRLAFLFDQSGFIGTEGPGPLNEIRVVYLRRQLR